MAPRRRRDRSAALTRPLRSVDVTAPRRRRDGSAASTRPLRRRDRSAASTRPLRRHVRSADSGGNLAAQNGFAEMIDGVANPDAPAEPYVDALATSPDIAARCSAMLLSTVGSAYNLLAC